MLICSVSLTKHHLVLSKGPVDPPPPFFPNVLMCSWLPQFSWDKTFLQLYIATISTKFPVIFGPVMVAHTDNPSPWEAAAGQEQAAG